ncbi:MAG: radical SAM family heme chaperone HemW [Desulfuromonadales bacterium]|jgi:oxygen-independent coproporphyrinogen-3 oxidase|nr:radical SAM family heme chaperone HemW [Desulfuromonadales bacterium]MDH4024499.1 radical SAM family heme chaperone HemW [Desulfuromonadales bacterium]
MAGLYVHIPFCHRKCPYCDFFSIASTDLLLETYPSLLIKHLNWASSHKQSGPFETIYFGGGTPSLLPPESIADILQVVQQAFGITHNAEITFEANPGTVSEQSLAGYRQAGINRLSLGLQTCNDKHLATLGRLHNQKEGLDAFSRARDVGFDNISLDLMFALPAQTTAEFEEDLHSFLELSPEHLSCYGLTAEPETPFHRKVKSGEMTLPDEDFYADTFMLVHKRLSEVGYEHYEIANYALKGRACRHNLGYWQRQSFLGIGPGAHSFCARHWGSRSAVPPDLAAYQHALVNAKEPTQHLEVFDQESALRETIYLALRTRNGISDSELQQRFGCTLQEAFPKAVEASAPWLIYNNGRWTLTPAGWLIFDRLILPFL